MMKTSTKKINGIISNRVEACTSLITSRPHEKRQSCCGGRGLNTARHLVPRPRVRHLAPRAAFRGAIRRPPSTGEASTTPYNPPEARRNAGAAIPRWRPPLRAGMQSVASERRSRIGEPGRCQFRNRTLCDGCRLGQCVDSRADGTDSVPGGSRPVRVTDFP